MKRAEELALSYYRSGLYCSEAILKAFNEAYNLGLPESSYKMATGFGSGMAGSGCACGALTACVMVLGLVAGRTHKGQSETLVFDAVSRLQAEFKAEYKSACCRSLTRQVEWGSKAHKSQCEHYVLSAVQITERMLVNELSQYLPENGSRQVPHKWSPASLLRRLNGTVRRRAAGPK